ncbi:MAG: hypothetical protein CR985_04085 [Flavobacteriales bacterium]|nr:MAG: hypothetical protein CR985_04085 [Flavobacteriales bacterium]
MHNIKVYNKTNLALLLRQDEFNGKNKGFLNNAKNKAQILSHFRLKRSQDEFIDKTFTGYFSRLYFWENAQRFLSAKMRCYIRLLLRLSSFCHKFYEISS